MQELALLTGTRGLRRGLREKTHSSYRSRLTFPGRVRAENPVTSRDLDVLVEEAAEPVSSENVDRRDGGSPGVALGRALMQ